MRCTLLAYIDPGVGSLLVQVLIAAVVSALVALRRPWQMLARLFRHPARERTSQFTLAESPRVHRAVRCALCGSLVQSAHDPGDLYTESLPGCHFPDAENGFARSAQAEFDDYPRSDLSGVCVGSIMPGLVVDIGAERESA